MNEIEKLAKIIWDYHHLHQPLAKADAILALGSHDIRVAEYAADLFLKNYAPTMIFSGGLGKLTKDWTKTEAEIFSDVAIQKGVPAKEVLLETKSSNTGENILFTKQLLENKNLKFKKIIVVHKPYMERRTYATFKKVWPDQEIIVSSPDISFENYLDHARSRQETISVMVRDLEKIKTYAELGFQIEQEIPKEVWAAYVALVESGWIINLG
ncbi:MAG: YdcF family protein [Candidatus Buchananbacteria bacterium]|nr:YdcF family protein [Candidatus Buchananbacteria bacterium]